MNLVEIIVLAVALGVDCLVVSFSQGLIYKTKFLRNSLGLALSMGFFQGFMPFISYFVIEIVSKYVQPYSKWLVFIIFFMLGLKFIIESFHKKEEKYCCIHWKCLLGLGIATSIDAFAAGVNLNLTSTSLLLSILIIGFVSLGMSLIGYWIGVFFKKLPSRVLEVTGGLILIFLAVKNLF